MLSLYFSTDELLGHRVACWHACMVVIIVEGVIIVSDDVDFLVFWRVFSSNIICVDKSHLRKAPSHLLGGSELFFRSDTLCTTTGERW